MKIVCISDTHMQHDIKIPKGDVLIHAGDFSVHRDTMWDLEIFAKWFQSQPHKHKILVPGNHDWCFQNRPEESRELLDKTIVLINEFVIINGTKFYGTPYQPIFYDWAFNVPTEQLKLEFAKIPRDTDVLITHTPPYGILDFVDRHGAGHVGCPILKHRVDEVSPKVHMFGHIHESYGQVTIDKTLYVNAAICDDSYKANHKPIAITI